MKKSILAGFLAVFALTSVANAANFNLKSAVNPINAANSAGINAAGMLN